jgi:hypothetical protein
LVLQPGVLCFGEKYSTALLPRVLEGRNMPPVEGALKSGTGFPSISSGLETLLSNAS